MDVILLKMGTQKYFKPGIGDIIYGMEVRRLFGKRLKSAKEMISEPTARIQVTEYKGS